MLEAGRLAGDAPLTAGDLLRGLHAIRFGYASLGSAEPAIIGRAKTVSEMIDALYGANVVVDVQEFRMSLRMSLACGSPWPSA